MYLFIYSKLLLKTDIQHWIRQISDSNRPLRLSCTKNRVNFPSQHLLRATSQVMTIATDVAFCFFLSFFLLGQLGSRDEQNVTTGGVTLQLSPSGQRGICCQ